MNHVPLLLQIYNVKRACGNMGRDGFLTLTATTSTNVVSDDGQSATLAVALGGQTFLTITNPKAEGGPLSAAVSLGANVSPSSPFPATTPTTWSLDVPCAILPNATFVPLAFSFTSDISDDFTLDNVAINACIVETCGGQYISCGNQQLLSSQPCTPDYDCNPSVCCM